MDWNLVVLRKIIDDPDARRKVQSLLTSKHFTHKRYAVFYEQITSIESNGIVTGEMLEHQINEFAQRYPRAGPVLLEVLGQVLALSPQLDSQLTFAIEALSREAQSDTFYTHLNQVSGKLERGDLEGVQQTIEDLPNLVNELKISSSRVISARTMKDLKPDEDTQRFETGFQRIDEITGGGRKRDFWLWAAYTGNYKSTALIAIAHQNFLRGHNVFFVSLEMDEDEIRRRLLCQHAVYLAERLRYQDLERNGVAITDVRERVASDFDDNESYGQIEMWFPPLGIDINDIAKEHERISSRIDCEVIILDYVQELSPLRTRGQSRDERNETLRYCKRLASEARNRDGVWLVSGYQTNTVGWKAAQKEGYYDLSGLSETIFAARCANVVVWSLQTADMLSNKELKVGIAKSRNSAISGSQHFLVCDPEFGLLSKEPIREEFSGNIESIEDVGDLLE